MGSEMCIRDRVEAVLVVERGAQQQLRRGGVDDDAHLIGPELSRFVVVGEVAVEEHLVRETAAPTGANSHAPVSYTHLTLPTIYSV